MRKRLNEGIAGGDKRRIAGEDKEQGAKLEAESCQGPWGSDATCGMSQAAVPEGYHSVTPFLAIRGVQELIDVMANAPAS